jgi:2-phosphoglycolate phosphatase
MKDHRKITGKIVRGVNQGAFFTQLGWVQEQCLEKLGFKPFPGTLNLEIPDESVAIIEALQPQDCMELVPPDSNFCSGFVFPIFVEGISGAIVAPVADVRVHGKNIIEIISHLGLKDALGLVDGDWVTLTIDIRLAHKQEKLNMEIQLPFKNRKLTVDAVMFDLDGTLIDTVPIYYEIIDIVFAELGVPAVSRESLMDAMDDGDFNWGRVLPDHMKKQKNELSKKAQRIVDEIAPAMFHKQVKLIPGTEGIFNEIAVTGTKIGLVTSTPAQRMAAKLIPLSNTGLVDLLEVIVTADDVRHKKPSAEPLIQCSQKLGVLPQKCVYVGDTRVDIRAGKAASMGTVGVLTGFDDYDALKNEAPDVIIDSIAQLSEILVIGTHWNGENYP